MSRNTRMQWAGKVVRPSAGKIRQTREESQRDQAHARRRFLRRKAECEYSNIELQIDDTAQAKGVTL